MLTGGALVDSGWYKSFQSERPVDRDGKPVAWYTYPCRAFLEMRLTPDMRVFEYGAGNSTLWYAERVAQVVAVEHDPEWAAILRPQLPSNCELVMTPNDESYLQAIKDFDPFDVVVVDGMRRPQAAIAALDGLKPDGVMIWDNSDWEEEFNAGFPALEAQGFRRIPFRGLGPVNRHAWETSIIYRDENCLGI
jgi:hypothetical protein